MQIELTQEDAKRAVAQLKTRLAFVEFIKTGKVFSSCDMVDAVDDLRDVVTSGDYPGGDHFLRCSICQATNQRAIILTIHYSMAMVEGLVTAGVCLICTHCFRDYLLQRYTIDDLKRFALRGEDSLKGFAKQIILEEIARRVNHGR